MNFDSESLLTRLILSHNQCDPKESITFEKHPDKNK